MARAAGAVVLAGLLALEAADFYGQNVALAYSEIYVAYWRIVLVLAIVGILVTAFEMPPRWPTTIVHLVNSVFFVVLSLVFVRLHGIYYDPGNGPLLAAALASLLTAAALLLARYRPGTPASR